MSYKDPDQQRTYQREYQRLRRSGSCQTPGQTLLPTEFRVQTARDVLDLIQEQVEAVRAEPDAGTLEKARCVGYLAGIALKAVEVAGLADRIDSLEKALKGRKDRASCNTGIWPTDTTN